MREPLTLIEGTLGLGDPASRHVTLGRSGIAYHEPGQPAQRLPWDQVVEIEAELAVSRIPDPIRSVILPIAVAVIGLIEWVPEPKESVIHITTDQQGPISWNIDAPWMGGYSRKEVQRAQSILQHLREYPESRDLLDKPEDLLQAIT